MKHDARQYGSERRSSPPCRRGIETFVRSWFRSRARLVASVREAWIETSWSTPTAASTESVASRAEAWIETSRMPPFQLIPSMSPPVRRRGLKHATVQPKSATGLVASRAEAWIETLRYTTTMPFSGTSPPVRRRGLKQPVVGHGLTPPLVASRAEAWIETTNWAVRGHPMGSRLPCGGVD